MRTVADPRCCGSVTRHSENARIVAVFGASPEAAGFVPRNALGSADSLQLVAGRRCDRSHQVLVNRTEKSRRVTRPNPFSSVPLHQLPNFHHDGSPPTRVIPKL